jgi:hypothetical protein
MEAAIARLSAHAIDVMTRAPTATGRRPALLRAVRAGEHARIHPAQPVITMGADDELTVLRAYECGSDHHIPDGAGYRAQRILTDLLEEIDELPDAPAAAITSHQPD